MKDSRCADYAEGLFSRDELRSNRRYGCVWSRADKARHEYQLGASAADKCFMPSFYTQSNYDEFHKLWHGCLLLFGPFPLRLCPPTSTAS